MRRAAASLMLGWLVLLGPGANAQTSLVPVPPGHVKVRVEFRQAGQRAQRGIDVKGTGPGGTVASADLGDRVAVEAIAVESGTIRVQLIVHDEDDPMCCPTKRVTWEYRLQEGKLVKMQP